MGGLVQFFAESFQLIEQLIRLWHGVTLVVPCRIKHATDLLNDKYASLFTAPLRVVQHVVLSQPKKRRIGSHRSDASETTKSAGRQPGKLDPPVKQVCQRFTRDSDISVAKNILESFGAEANGARLILAICQLAIHNAQFSWPY